MAVTLGLASVGEAVVDKLPGVPPRTSPLPLAGRVVLGALCGTVIARRRSEQAPLAATLGAVAAAFVAIAATHLRRRLTAEGRSDLTIGLGEDAVVWVGGRLLRPYLQ